VINYEYENGRRYHAYNAGAYLLPNDETEQYRLELQNQVYRLCLGGATHCAPIANPQRVLDVGTGTGNWAIDFADRYPGALVIGTDLSPIQPTFVPPNLKFYIDDFERPWEFGESEKFDFIHWRSLAGSTGDWQRLYRQARDSLRPGAYLEVQEYDAWVYSDDDNQLERASWTKEWMSTLATTSLDCQKPLNVGRFQKPWMEEAGFVDVTERTFKVRYRCNRPRGPCDILTAGKVPIGQWPRDHKLKELGGFERMHMNESIEAYSMALYTRVLGYSMEQAQVVFSMVKQELNDRNLHLYTIYRFIYGRKPE
jgi:SAM-dependent methyltransferase